MQSQQEPTESGAGPETPLRPACFEPVAVDGHALLDSGGGWKLERFGERILARPDPQALWRPRLSKAEWEQADMTFVRDEPQGGKLPKGIPTGKRGRWRGRAAKHGGADWLLEHDGLGFVLKPTSFKHVGLFPEQATNWRYIERSFGAFDALDSKGRATRPTLLNLFGYTGAASIVARRAGYAVTHVDASRTTLGWVKENLEASHMSPDALRLILDDALGFARREVRRGSRYEGVVLDPPHYGRGPKGEKWQLEEQLAPLLEVVAELLAERSFCILSTYAIGYSPLAFVNMLDELGGGRTEAGELVLQEAGGRLLPAGFCARWSRGL